MNGMTERHHAIRDYVFDVCTKGGIHARPEQGCFEGTRDADLLLVGWSRGRNTAVDFTVSHPLAPATWPLQTQRVKDTLKKAEARKVALAEARCKYAGWSYAAAAMSPWGMTGPSATSLMREITRRATAALSGRSLMKKAEEIAQGFSITMARQLARQLQLRYRVLEDASDLPC
jgi:hypothetical protein